MYCTSTLRQSKVQTLAINETPSTVDVVQVWSAMKTVQYWRMRILPVDCIRNAVCICTECSHGKETPRLVNNMDFELLMDEARQKNLPYTLSLKKYYSTGVAMVCYYR